MRNQYPGTCAGCGCRVAAGAGEWSRSGGLRHARCGAVTASVAASVAAVAPRDTVDLRLGEGGVALVTPRGWLGPARFAAYKAACDASGAPARKDAAERWAQIATLQAVGGVVVALEAAGFSPAIAPTLAAALQARASQAAVAVSEADERAAAVDASLRARGLALFAFQRTGVRWLAGRERALLADGMGLGKTIQALTAVPEGAPVVVVCPAAIKGVWRSEAAKWRPDMRATCLSGRKSWRWPQPGEIVVLNPAILPEAASVGPAPEGACVVIDEAHEYKDGKTRRAKKVRAITAAARAAHGRAWALTGTPLLNRPQELWHVLATVGLEADAFAGWGNFVKLFRGTKGEWGGYSWGTPAPEIVDCLRRVSLARRKADVLADLPEKTYRDLPVGDLDAATRTICDDVLALLASRGIDLAAAERDVLAAANGAAFAEISRARAALATAKIPHLLGLVEEYEGAEEPVVVFSAHRAPVEALGAREGWAAITGDTSPDERTRIVERFQAGQLKGLVATIQAAGVGLTLTRASQIIFVDLLWTPALNAQAEDRCHRIGQTRGVIVTRLVAEHPLDERVNELLAGKQALISATTDAAATPRDPEASATDLAAEPVTAVATVLLAPAAPVPLAPQAPAPTRRNAQVPIEAWAADAIRALAADDPDGPSVGCGDQASTALPAAGRFPPGRGIGSL